MKKIFIIVFAVIFSLALIACAKTTQINIEKQVTKFDEIIRFSEDKKTDINLNGYNIHSYSIKDEISDRSFKNIWVTYEFLNNKEYSSIIKSYLDNGYTVLIEGKIDTLEAYDLLTIDEKSRADKGTRENTQTSQINLHQTGVVLFKDKDYIYGTDIRIEEFSNYYKDLLSVFTTMNKKTMVY